MVAKKVMDAVLAPTPEVPALKIIGEVRVLHVTSPSDVIVIKADFPISSEECEQVIAKWKHASLLPNPVVILVQGLEVDVVRPGSKA